MLKLWLCEPFYLPALRATFLQRKASGGAGSADNFYAGGAGERAERAIKTGIVPEGHTSHRSAKRHRCHIKIRRRRRHLLKPSAVCRQPSALDPAERASPVFQSFSLSVFQSPVSRTNVALQPCTPLHFALSNRNMREAHPELLISNCYLLISHFPHMLQYNDRKNGNFIGIYIDARYV